MTADLFDRSNSVDQPDPVAHIRHLPIPEQLKYCMARWVWLRRTTACPIKQEMPDGRREEVTWEYWFELRFKQRLTDYVAYCQSNYDKPTRSSAHG